MDSDNLENLEGKVFVTGATGMVGFHLVKHLAENGYRVVALVRSNQKLSLFDTLPKDNLAIIEGALHDKEFLQKAMNDCLVVVHCAGAVDPHAKREDIFSVNVTGTENCLAAASAAKIKQFIHISSLSVITGQKDQFQVNEEAPLRLCGEAYADSKVEAEKAVMTYNNKDQEIKVTILRPGFIYGPMEKAWLPKVIASLKSGKAMLIDDGYKQTNVIYVENLCKAVELSMLNEKAYGQVYNLTDGNTPSKKELFDAICDGLSLPRVRRSIPSPIAFAICEIVSSIAPMLPKAIAMKMSKFSRAAFRLAGVNQGFDIRKAERDLGYTASNRASFACGIERTLKSINAETNNPTKDEAVLSAGLRR